MNRLTDIFAVGKFDYGVMVRYHNLTRKPELFRAPLGPCTMYPLNPPLAGPASGSQLRLLIILSATLINALKNNHFYFQMFCTVL